MVLDNVLVVCLIRIQTMLYLCTSPCTSDLIYFRVEATI